MDEHRINELIRKYADGTANESETEELMKWYHDVSYEDVKYPGDEDKIYHNMRKRLEEVTDTGSTVHSFRRWWVAASFLVLFGGGLAVYLVRSHSDLGPVTAVNVVKPGGNRAILTLADGKKISLTDATNGALAKQGNVHITKMANGQLVYAISGPANAGQITYNTIETPAGGQYQVILPDKSKVWLNSLSSLKFPVNFDNQKERRVELTGEAYFEVTHNDKIPFRVITDEAITEDIGTAFNIKAYHDEANQKMTLVQGAIKVKAGNNNLSLKPGEQATYNGKISIAEVNVEDVIAWKSGYFRFDEDNLEDIMKILSRWYAVKYVFADEDLKKETFGAVTNRFTDISKVLSLMENAGLAHFQIDKSTIIISKKKN